MIILDTPIPKTCATCPCFDGECGECQVPGIKVDRLWLLLSSTRPINCPIIGEPEWLDNTDALADALIKARIDGMTKDVIYEKAVTEGMKCQVTVKLIDNRPSHCGSGL